MDQARVLSVLRMQHNAIDMLLARVITLDPTFLPTESGKIWDAVMAGHPLIQELEKESQ